jgi:hypothetical protein
VNSASLRDAFKSQNPVASEQFLLELEGQKKEIDDLKLKLKTSKLFMNMIIHDLKHPTISF